MVERVGASRRDDVVRFDDLEAGLRAGRTEWQGPVLHNLATMRVAIGGITHETNTYAVASTGLTGIEQFVVHKGDAIADVSAGTGTALGGIVDACACGGDEVVGLLYGLAEPSGTITAAAYASLKAGLVDALRSARPVDAVALELHGAGVAEGVDDIEADLGAAIRDLLGPGVPVAAVLDLHGNVTPEMAKVYNVLLGCHLYPHTDLSDRGREAIALLRRTVAGEIHPVVHVEQLPILLPTSTTDGDSPAARVNAICLALEQQPGILDCTFMHGFPFTDIPAVGATIITVADGDSRLAAATARDAATWVWDHRGDFRVEHDTPESAVRRAAAATHGPVVINECSDNPGGGTPGDGTHLLRAMVEGRVEDACFGFISDPEVVAAATVAGVGATINVNLGGKHDALHGTPLSLRGARVRCITDGRLTLRAMLAGVTIEVGPTCRLTAGGIEIVVSSRPFQTIDTEIFLMHGIDVTRYRLVGLKSSNHFRAGFRDLASDIITADSPGLTTNRVEVFDHGRATRPLWPTDPGAAYPPATS